MKHPKSYWSDECGWCVELGDFEKVYKAANRYEALRKLSPQQFTELWNKALTGGKTFDSLVEELI